MRVQASREWDEDMILGPAQLKALLDHLDETLAGHPLRSLASANEGVSKSERRRRRRPRGFDQPVRRGSDCEVLANVDPQTQVGGRPRYLELYGSG